MPLRLTANGSRFTNDATLNDAPAVELAGDGITLVNSELGRILASSAGVAAVVVSGVGSRIENAAGAVIQAATSVDNLAVLGGSGNDVLVNRGAINGVVDLGAGDDSVTLYAAIDGTARVRLGNGEDTLTLVAQVTAPGVNVPQVLPNADGGDGIDTLMLSGMFGTLNGANIGHFESLVVSAPIPTSGSYANNLVAFSGYAQVSITAGSQAGFVDSVNPLATVTLAGSSLDIASNSVFGAVAGSDLADRVYLSGNGQVLGAIDLGGGDDLLFLFTGPDYQPPAHADGGAGSDYLAIVTSGVLDIDLSRYAGFESAGDYGNIRSSSLTLRNADGLATINFSYRSLLTLVDSQSPGAALVATASNVVISADSVVGRFGFAGMPGWQSLADVAALTTPNLAMSSSLVNHGAVLGDIAFYTGDDVYDGTDGSVGGTVYGFAGNDVLRGGSGAERMLGGYGADLLVGNGGADTLRGEQGGDTLIGGAGNDALDGGAGRDRAVFAATRADSTVTRNADGTVTISSALDGTDTVANVERFEFAGVTYALGRFANIGAVAISGAVGAGGGAGQGTAPRHLADVNGDGLADVVGFGPSGVLVSYGSASGDFLGPVVAGGDFGQASGWVSDNRYPRELADFNGDGRADIVGFGQAGALVALAQANGAFAATVLGLADFGANQGWASQDRFARGVGDVNGDGKADLIGFGQAGTLVALGRGDGSFGAVVQGVENFGVNQGWTSDTTFHRAVGDVNGDGKVDLIGFGQAGTYVALSNGDGTFGAAAMVLADFGVAQGWSSNDRYARLVADVDGDGRADIVGFGQAGVLIAHGRSDGRFGEVTFDLANFGVAQGWTSDAVYHRELADVNGDGLVDIVGFGATAVLVALNQATTTGDLVL